MHRMRCRLHATARVERFEKDRWHTEVESGTTRDSALEPNLFPGRWSARRAVPTEIAPLPLVCAEALERAGWWRPGSGETCRGGLVVAIEGISLPAHAGFVEELAEDPAIVGPSGFLYALPSTAASVIGLLFGLQDYQATLTEGALGGLKACGHALDALALDRVGESRRLLVAAVGQVPGERRAAAALALEVVDPGANPSSEETFVDVLTSTDSYDQMHVSPNRLGVDELVTTVRLLEDVPKDRSIRVGPDTLFEVLERGF